MKMPSDSVIFSTYIDAETVAFQHETWYDIYNAKYKFGKVIYTVKDTKNCKLCGDIIESEFCQNFVKWSCGTCSVAGAHGYLRRIFSCKYCYI